MKRGRFDRLEPLEVVLTDWNHFVAIHTLGTTVIRKASSLWKAIFEIFEWNTSCLNNTWLVFVLCLFKRNMWEDRNTNLTLIVNYWNQMKCFRYSFVTTMLFFRGIFGLKQLIFVDLTIFSYDIVIIIVAIVWCRPIRSTMKNLKTAIAFYSFIARRSYKLRQFTSSVTTRRRE